MPWLAYTNQHSFPGVGMLLPTPLPHQKKNWVLLARRKGNEAVTMSLLRGFGGLLNGCPVSPFMIQRTTWTHKSAKEHRAPEIYSLDQDLCAGHQFSLPVHHSFPHIWSQYPVFIQGTSPPSLPLPLVQVKLSLPQQAWGQTWTIRGLTSSSDSNWFRDGP